MVEGTKSLSCALGCFCEGRRPPRAGGKAEGRVLRCNQAGKNVGQWTVGCHELAVSGEIRAELVQELVTPTIQVHVNEDSWCHITRMGGMGCPKRVVHA